MRTLVISDLHIGQPGGTAVLERQKPLDILIEKLSGCDRLVLLGDTIELTEGHWSHSALAAAPIFKRLGETVAEIVLVPGNHDHRLIEDWAQVQGDALAREARVPNDVSPQLREVVGWLSQGGAAVEVRYPGVWLTDSVWATHGHYLNHFLRPISSYGRHPKQQRHTCPGAMRPAEFEHIVYGERHPDLAEGVPPRRWHDRLVPSRLAPAVSWGLDLQVRRHALPAFAKATAALGIAVPEDPAGPRHTAGPGDPAAPGHPAALGAGAPAGEARGPAGPRAEYAIFAHIHRLGPLPLDNPREWQAGPDLQLLNTGSWRYEPVLVSRSDSLHPYWPGGAVELGDDGVPRAVNLLSGLTHADLR